LIHFYKRSYETGEIIWEELGIVSNSWTRLNVINIPMKYGLNKIENTIRLKKCDLNKN